MRCADRRLRRDAPPSHRCCFRQISGAGVRLLVFQRRGNALYVFLFPRILSIGEKRLALLALLLLTLPLEFTFHVLFELPRLAERRRTFCYSLHPVMFKYSCTCIHLHRTISLQGSVHTRSCRASSFPLNLSDSAAFCSNISSHSDLQACLWH